MIVEFSDVAFRLAKPSRKDWRSYDRSSRDQKAAACLFDKIVNGVRHILPGEASDFCEPTNEMLARFSDSHKSHVIRIAAHHVRLKATDNTIKVYISGIDPLERYIGFGR